jgi:hypothetical protein
MIEQINRLGSSPFFIGIMIWPDYVNNPVAPFNNFKSKYGPNYIPGMKAMFNAVYATSVWGPVKNYSTNSSFLEKVLLSPVCFFA